MFRKTLIAAALASAAFFALGSAAPASADAWDCLVDPAGCKLAEIGVQDPGLGIIHVVPDPAVQVAPIDVPEMWEPPFDFGDIVIPGPTEEDPAVDPDEESVEEAADDPAEDAVEESVEETADESAEELSEEAAPTTTVAPATDTSSGEATSSAAVDDGTQTTATVATESADTASDAALADTGAGGSFDPIMAAMFGALGALAVALLTLTGFIAGRRS